MKIPNLSHKYSGKLTSSQLAEGIRCCIENAGYLVSTASHLIDTNFYGPASSLCFTALEEIGKAHVLHTMAQYPREGQKHWKSCWQEFRDHQEKYTRGMMDFYGDEHRTSLSEMLKVISKESQVSKFAERMRQFGLYVDFNSEDGTWYSPSTCTKDHAQALYNTAHTAYERNKKLLDAGLFDTEILDQLPAIYGDLLIKMKSTVQDVRELQRYEPELAQAHRKYFELLVELGMLNAIEDIPYFRK